MLGELVPLGHVRRDAVAEQLRPLAPGRAPDPGPAHLPVVPHDAQLGLGRQSCADLVVERVEQVPVLGVARAPACARAGGRRRGCTPPNSPEASPLVNSGRISPSGIDLHGPDQVVDLADRPLEARLLLTEAAAELLGPPPLEVASLAQLVVALPQLRPGPASRSRSSRSSRRAATAATASSTTADARRPAARCRTARRTRSVSTPRIGRTREQRQHDHGDRQHVPEQRAPAPGSLTTHQATPRGTEQATREPEQHDRDGRGQGHGGVGDHGVELLDPEQVAEQRDPADGRAARPASRSTTR